MSFEAKYHGTCEDCGEHITPGDLINFADMNLRSVAHADCTEDSLLPERVEVTCTECWLIKPCECDDTTTK